MVPKISPLVPCNNPAAAIELDLLDSLKHLVEEKNIDINAYKWTA